MLDALFSWYTYLVGVVAIVIMVTAAVGVTTYLAAHLLGERLWNKLRATYRLVILYIWMHRLNKLGWKFPTKEAVKQEMDLEEQEIKEDK